MSLLGSWKRGSAGYRLQGVQPATPASPGLVAAFEDIRGGHQAATVRTVARAALPGSISRVFMGGTKAKLVELLPSLPVETLPGLAGQDEYRAWFEKALARIDELILQMNPRSVNPRIHPQTRWGHGAKVLSVFVRDLVLYSRYFSDGEMGRIAPWLYCPVDGIVIEGLRKFGHDPGASYIKDIDQQTFWRIQAWLGEAAAANDVPRVWFDDIWSGPRV